MVLKRLVALICIVEVALICNPLHQRPREATFIKLVTPFFLKTLMSQPQIVGRNRSGNMMGNVDINVVAEEFYPTGIIAVNGAK